MSRVVCTNTKIQRDDVKLHFLCKCMSDKTRPITLVVPSSFGEHPRGGRHHLARTCGREEWLAEGVGVRVRPEERLRDGVLHA